MMEETVVGILKKQRDEVRCLLRSAGVKRNAVLVDTCLLSQVTGELRRYQSQTKIMQLFITRLICFIRVLLA